MTRILVTGAGGFIGRGLLPRLAAGGYDVRAASRQPGNPPAESISVGPIGPDTDWAAALDGIDAVVHLAARVHVTRDDSGDPLAAFRQVNAAGTARLARQAVEAGVRRFVLVSSVKAAAETSPGRPLRETDPARPRTPYGISKWEGEQALRAEAGRMEAIVLRPPLVYGPGVGANFRALLRLVDAGLPLPLGSVGNRRSLIARANLVDAIVASLVASGAAGGTFYVADGPPLSTPALVRKLAAALGRPARLFSAPIPLIANLARLLGRADAAASLLSSLEIDDAAFRAAAGWRPPLEQGTALREVAAWYKAARTGTEKIPAPVERQ